MTADERQRVEELKARRAELKTPMARVAFDNDVRNGPFGVRVLAAIESHPTHLALSTTKEV